MKLKISPSLLIQWEKYFVCLIFVTGKKVLTANCSQTTVYSNRTFATCYGKLGHRYIAQ